MGTLLLWLRLLSKPTLTRSPPTHLTTPWLTTTPPPTSMLPSPVTELAVPRVLTMSTSLTAAPSMLVIAPTPSTDLSLRSPTKVRLSILKPLKFALLPLLPLLLLYTLPLLSTQLLLSTLPLLSMLLRLFTLLYTLHQLFTLLPLFTPVLLARALTNLSTSLSRERRGPLARPRHSDPRSPLLPRLIPSVTQLTLVWPSISVRELLFK